MKSLWVRVIVFNTTFNNSSSFSKTKSLQIKEKSISVKIFFGNILSSSNLESLNWLQMWKKVFIKFLLKKLIPNNF
jgi:hypothetical protein